MTTWAKPGVKCVCVDGERRRDESGHIHHDQVLPPEGSVVLISEVYRHSDRGIALVVAGYPNYCSVIRRDAGWALDRFRPLITQEDDVRLIKSLLLEDAGLVPAGVELDA